MTHAHEEIDGDWPDVIMLNITSGPMWREAAEAARVLIAARLDVDTTPDSELLNDEVTQQVRRLGAGLPMWPANRKAFTESIEWAGYLLTALAFIPGLVAEVGSASAGTVLASILDSRNVTLDDETKQLVEQALAPERIIERTFYLIERNRWTLRC